MVAALGAALVEEATPTAVLVVLFRTTIQIHGPKRGWEAVVKDRSPVVVA
jgi:hypothetical protein